MKLNVTAKVINDVTEIKNYIKEEFENAAAAERIADKIMQSYERLETMPYIGKRLNAVVDIDSDYRFLVCENYLIFYEVKDDIVSVYRVIHGKRDYYSMLFGDE